MDKSLWKSICMEHFDWDAQVQVLEAKAQAVKNLATKLRCGERQIVDQREAILNEILEKKRRGTCSRHQIEHIDAAIRQLVSPDYLSIAALANYCANTVDTLASEIRRRQHRAWVETTTIQLTREIGLFTANLEIMYQLSQAAFKNNAGMLEALGLLRHTSSRSRHVHSLSDRYMATQNQLDMEATPLRPCAVSSRVLPGDHERLSAFLPQ